MAFLMPAGDQTLAEYLRHSLGNVPVVVATRVANCLCEANEFLSERFFTGILETIPVDTERDNASLYVRVHCGHFGRAVRIQARAVSWRTRLNGKRKWNARGDSILSRATNP